MYGAKHEDDGNGYRKGTSVADTTIAERFHTKAEQNDMNAYH
jgi:hypothetical protein